jgi:DNA mismatch repair protein MutL
VRVLPEVLVHQIAAGEIVERPSSVVKELVENSIDASSEQIHVAVEEGGKRLIRVTDDGDGMSADDATLAFEHHATSKIAVLDDLVRIRTLGFRGEALPSIASVSRTRLKTVDREAVQSGPALGTEIEYVGGKRTGLREISWPKGTEILVEDLFFNIPARRKFLKTTSTELSHVSRVLTGYALACPQIEFKLLHKGRNLLDASPVPTLRDRVFQLLGDSLVQNMVPVEHNREEIYVSGMTSLPHEQRNNANSLYLYVNGRIVRDRVLTHAIRQAYRDLIPAAAFPVTLLFVELDAERIDVNVHPTKVEIRFQDSQKVHSAILHAIEEALLLNRKNLSSLARDIPFRSSSHRGTAGGVLRSAEKFYQRNPTGTFAFGKKGSVGQESRPGRSQFGQDPDCLELRSRTCPKERLPISEGLALPEIPETVPGYHADDIPETAHFSEAPSVLGQFVESFIVAVDREGVMLVDQHVAHERILYDRALRSLESDATVPTQQLLLPVTLDLSPQQRSVARQILDHLNTNGFEIEWFGESTVAVKGVPALAGDIDSKKILEDILDEIQRLDRFTEGETESTQTVRRIREKIAISLSCHAAIKVNTPLTTEKMDWLVEELFRCANPYTCPHGRPIVLRLNIEEILRGFKRI